jgi:hypothetical protein
MEVSDMPSTVIADMAYDPETQTLSVWFRPSGRRYDYLEVPAIEYDALRRSPSKGRYFNAHIRDGSPSATRLTKPLNLHPNYFSHRYMPTDFGAVSAKPYWA